ncbi:hypothetical protein [Xanthomonas sp. NCPPB 2632]|uniref:hypothetical protein n=1 Tax=Xanthomonas sp. NCPPB 2632 TaxID=3240912 RepID=UPI0035120BAB
MLTVVALLSGKFYGASWLDPVMGIAGSVLVARWAIGLLRESGNILLDAKMDSPVIQEVRDVIATNLPQAHITDLHVRRVGRGAYACILRLMPRKLLIGRLLDNLAGAVRRSIWPQEFYRPDLVAFDSSTHV